MIEGSSSSEPITARFLLSLSTSPAPDSVAYDLALTPASFPTLCENEAAGCDVTKHCDEDSPEMEYCQKACSACVEATGGSGCRFNRSELGHWLEMSHRRADDDDDDSQLITVSEHYYTPTLPL